MFHDGGGVFDAFDVLVDVDILIGRMQVATRIGKARQDAWDPDMFQNGPLG